MVGREIWANQNHAFSAGANFKFLIPGAYMNLGLNNLQGTLIRNQDEYTLSNARGTLNINYPGELEDWDILEENLNRYSLKNISGLALDLGLTHQWMKNGVTKFSSGLSLKNLGSLDMGAGQVINTYAMDIPEGEFYRLDQLDGDLDEIEDQLLSSGYFTKNAGRESAKSGLPSVISIYTDMRVTRRFHVSVFGQKRLSDPSNNTQLSSQNVISLTPRLTLGNFEIYSPWAKYEVSGFTGGAGLRLGGFFIGSQSVLTGFLANSQHADIHMGFSMGFGKRRAKTI